MQRIERTPTACDTCRKRKRKCDTERPACGFCQRTNSTCNFTFSDKRRPPTRKEVQDLQRQVEILQSQLDKNSNRNGTSNEGGGGGGGPSSALVQSSETFHLLQKKTSRMPIEVPSSVLQDLSEMTPQLEWGSDRPSTSHINDASPANNNNSQTSALCILYADELSSFWQWQKDHFEIVHQQTLLDAISLAVNNGDVTNNAKPKQEGPLQALLRCMIALGSLHYMRWQALLLGEEKGKSSNSTRLPSVPYNTRHDTAKDLMHVAQLELYQEQKNAPSLVILQALVLSTIWFFGRGEVGVGWTFNAMMVSQFERLGLDSRQKKLPISHVPQSQLVLLCETVPRLDALFGLLCGQQPCLRRHNKKGWILRQKYKSTKISSTLEDDLKEVRLSKLDSLLDLIGDLNEQIEEKQPIESLDEEIRYRLLSKVSQSMADFERQLSRPLSDTSDSQTFQMHSIWFYYILYASTILLCRPFLAPPPPITTSSSSMLSTSNNNHYTNSPTVVLALMTSFNSAVAMAKLLPKVPPDTFCFTMPYLLAISNDILLACCLGENSNARRSTALKSLNQSVKIMKISRKVWQANKKLEDPLRELARKWQVKVPILEEEESDSSEQDTSSHGAEIGLEDWQEDNLWTNQFYSGFSDLIEDSHNCPNGAANPILDQLYTFLSSGSPCPDASQS